MGPGQDEAREFVEQLLRTGLTLIDLLSTLLEDLADDAFEGEDPAAVLVEMLVGTLRPVTEAAGSEAVVHATALLGAARDRTLADLRAAAAAADS
jgi:hypothetical protein